MLNRKLAILTILVMVAPLVLAACGPTPEPVTVVETSVVVETVEVEVAGETVVEEATRIIEKEVVVTATPEPEPTEEPMASISPEFKNPDTYVVVTGAGEPETLDPAWTYETAGSAKENNIYEGVVWFNKDRTDEFVGILATDWSVNDAGDQWTFNIRDGVTFHEGGTLEPHDIAYSVHRALLQDRIDGPHWMTLEAFFGLYTIEDLAMEIAGVESFDGFRTMPWSRPARWSRVRSWPTTRLAPLPITSTRRRPGSWLCCRTRSWVPLSTRSG
jgi:peptide/nickel transport system substrate-binding protein